MNELMIFNNPEFGEIRAIEQNGGPWFVAADVCRALELANTSDSLNRLDEDEKYRFNLGLPGGDTWCVNEPGLYSLVLGSRKSEAKTFKRWITHEVLPSIRKTGVYVLPTVKQRSLTTDDYLKAAAIVSGCRNERMPYVLGFLRQAGFSISEVRDRAEELQGELVTVLEEALNRGFTVRQIGKLAGIDYGTIAHYRRGEHRPNQKRAEYIIRIVRKAMENTNE